MLTFVSDPPETRRIDLADLRNASEVREALLAARQRLAE
jgi:hypothetical protein